MNSDQPTPPAIIELVDSEILALGSDGARIRTPGYALLEKGGIATGSSAFEQAWLYPQRSFNQFWHQLNLAPLPVSSAFARHYADLAFAQLKQIHRDLGQPAAVLFAIPGSFSKDQLSILLGLANALPVKTLGLLDSAVAAASTLQEHSGELLHLDVQLHQAVITRLSADNRVTRLGVELVPDAGIKAFHGSWAQQIANQFIREYRYDPLHTAQGEQQLFSKLPLWLEQLGHHSEVVAELNTPRGSFRLNLQRSALLESSAARWGKLRSLLQRLGPGCPVIASYRVQQLAGIGDQLGALVLDSHQVTSACSAALTQMDLHGDSVDFVTQLPRTTGTGASTGRRDTATSTEVPTHVLCGHRAVAIGRGLGLELDGDELRPDRDSTASLRLTLREGRLVLAGNSADLQVSGDRDNLRPGDSIVINGTPLTLIVALPEVPPGA